MSFNDIEEEYQTPPDIDYEHSTSSCSNRDEYLEELGLTADDLNEEVVYLINDFLVEQSITMIFAKASQGKSYFVLFVSIMLLKQEKIKKCIYIDMDNGKKALKQRKLDSQLESLDNLIYIHRSKLSGVNHIGLIDRMVNEAQVDKTRFEGYLIVIDSIRDFLAGGDMNKDKDIIPVMEKLKTLRDSGATIIFLHHSTKEREGNYYKGTTTFIDSIDVAYGLKKTEIERHKITSYALTVEKDRIAVDNTGFELNTETGEITIGNYEVSNMNEDETEFVSAVKAVLEECELINQGELLKEIGKKKDDKTALSRLKKFDGVFWVSERVSEKNNAVLYSKK